MDAYTANPVDPFTSPEVFALRQRVAELERENYYLREEKGLSLTGPMFTRVEDEQVRDLPTSYDVLALPRVAGWECRRDYFRGGYHAVGRTREGKDGTNLVYSYFADGQELLSAYDQAYVLAGLHKRMVQCLGQDLLKRSPTKG